MTFLGRWFALILMLSLLGCGYRPVGLEAPTGQERPTIAIPLFNNRSTEIGLESLLANTFIQTFSQNKDWRIVTQPQGADLVLEGNVRSVENRSIAFFDINRSLIRRVTIQVELNLRRKESGKIIWKETATFYEDYAVDPNYQAGEASKNMGIRRGAAVLARRILDKIALVL